MWTLCKLPRKVAVEAFCLLSERNITSAFRSLTEFSGLTLASHPLDTPHPPLSSEPLILETYLNVILCEDIFSLSRLIHQSYPNWSDFFLLILESPCEGMAKHRK